MCQSPTLCILCGCSENSYLCQNSGVYCQFCEIHECITSSALVITYAPVARGACFVWFYALQFAIDYQFIALVLWCVYWLFEGRSAHQCESTVLSACERAVLVCFLLKFSSRWHKVSRICDWYNRFVILNFFMECH